MLQRVKNIQYPLHPLYLFLRCFGFAAQHVLHTRCAVKWPD
jgi:hypothetical protein